jgi:hypothetical protein
MTFVFLYSCMQVLATYWQWMAPNQATTWSLFPGKDDRTIAMLQGQEQEEEEEEEEEKEEKEEKEKEEEEEEQQEEEEVVEAPQAIESNNSA